MTSLNLSYNEQITDAELAHLREMPLTSLDLREYHQITDAGKNVLKRAIPSLEVY